MTPTITKESISRKLLYFRMICLLLLGVTFVAVFSGVQWVYNFWLFFSWSALVASTLLALSYHKLNDMQVVSDTLEDRIDTGVMSSSLIVCSLDSLQSAVGTILWFSFFTAAVACAGESYLGMCIWLLVYVVLFLRTRLLQTGISAMIRKAHKDGSL